jgi:hypothetical protein
MSDFRARFRIQQVHFIEKTAYFLNLKANAESDVSANKP